MTLALMTAVSVVGLSVDDVYRAPKSVAAMLRGYDLVSLAVAVPALAVTLLPRFRQSVQAQLLRLAILGYAAYNYASYVFGTGFSTVFLLHDAAFTVATFALGFSAASLDLGRIYKSFRPSTPTRAIGGVLALLATGLGAMWIFYSLRFALAGELPKESLLVLPEPNLHLAYVLDLTLLVPGYAVAAALLWRRTRWGYPMAAALLVFSLVHELNYVVALVFQSNAHIPGATALDPQALVVIAVTSAATARSLRWYPSLVTERPARPTTLGPQALAPTRALTRPIAAIPATVTESGSCSSASTAPAQPVPDYWSHPGRITNRYT
jgi:hypothetical protein